MPKLSIIIPVFNTAKFLHSCIESCLNQSFCDIEIIIIDDKSTDNSLEVIEEFMAYDKRIKLIKNQNNLGTFLARAEGIVACSGEFIVFLDSDDCLSPICAQEVIKLKSYDIIHFGIIHYPPKTHASLPMIHKQELFGDEIVKQIVIDNFSKSWLNLCGRAYRASLLKEALSKLSFIDRHLIASEDTILFFVILLLAKSSVGIDENLYFYCENEESITRTNTQDKYLKQISDREYLKEVLCKLKQDSSLHKNTYFDIAVAKVQDLLDYFICFSKRFVKPKKANDIIPPYIKYSLACMKYMPRWQIVAKLVIYLSTFGIKKL